MGLTVSITQFTVLFLKSSQKISSFTEPDWGHVFGIPQMGGGKKGFQRNIKLSLNDKRNDWRRNNIKRNFLKILTSI